MAEIMSSAVLSSKATKAATERLIIGMSTWTFTVELPNNFQAFLFGGCYFPFHSLSVFVLCYIWNLQFLTYFIHQLIEFWLFSQNVKDTSIFVQKWKKIICLFLCIKEAYLFIILLL